MVPNFVNRTTKNVKKLVFCFFIIIDNIFKSFYYVGKIDRYFTQLSSKKIIVIFHNINSYNKKEI